MKPKEFFSQSLVLQNQQILLRPLEPSDIDVLYPIAIQPNLWEVGVTKISTREELETYIEEAITERQKQTSYPFLIMDKATHAAVGSTRFYDISFEHKRLSIGWTWIDQKWQGTGLNKACKYELLQYVFEDLGWNRVEFKVDALNLRSRKAIQKLGAKEEGTLRHHMITYTGRVRDTVFYSILQEEWSSIRENIFQNGALFHS